MSHQLLRNVFSRNVDWWVGRAKKIPATPTSGVKKLLVGILKQMDRHGQQQLIWYRQK